MPEKITIEKLRVGYKLTVSPQDNLVLTAQEMRDIYDYCLLHMAEIEAEAKGAINEDPRPDQQLDA